MALNSSRPVSLVPLTALIALAGCGALQPARLQLPEGLTARSEAVAFDGLGGGRSGSFTVAGDVVRFERGAGRLSLFDLVARDDASARYTLQRADGSTVQATCRAAQTLAQAGVVAAPLRPWRVACEGSGGARLTLQGQRGGTAGALAQREGRFEAQGVVLTLRAEHRLQGAAWDQADPVGYVLMHDGAAVGALDLSDTTRPVLHRPAAGPLRDAVTQAALALALLWDPAGR